MNIIVGAAEPVAEGLNSKLRSCPGVGRGKTGDQGVARGVKSQTDPLFKTGTIEIISQKYSNYQSSLHSCRMLWPNTIVNKK